MRLKLLFLPRYHADPNEGRPVPPPHFPPLGISVLTQFLREHSINVEQDDLDIKTYCHNNTVKNGNKKVRLELFNDINRANRFFESGHDGFLLQEGEKILKHTRLHNFDIFGLSLMPTDNPSSAAVAAVLAKLLKEKYGSTVIIGGSIETRVEKRLLETGLVDYRIIGNPSSALGEINLLDFCEKFGKRKDKEIRGIAFIRDGKHVCTNKELNEKERKIITKPCFEGLPMELYRREITRCVDGTEYSSRILVLPYYFIRGCPHRCAFCSNSLYDFWTAKDPELVAEELTEISKRYKTRFIYFHNPTINPTYSYAEKIADELISRDVNILWSDCANFVPMDSKLLRRLKGSGAARLVFGFECASPRVLKYIGKNFTVTQAERVLKEARRTNLWTELDMICGFPYESDSDVECTVRFMRKNKRDIGACSLNKFWLDGRFRKEPETFGIAFREKQSDTHTNWCVNQYDEVHGLKWEEKLRKTGETFTYLQSVINQNFPVAPGIHELFFSVAHGLKIGVERSYV